VFILGELAVLVAVVLLIGVVVFVVSAIGYSIVRVLVFAARGATWLARRAHTPKLPLHTGTREIPWTGDTVISDKVAA
jgi:hypothetical protein